MTALTKEELLKRHTEKEGRFYHGPPREPSEAIEFPAMYKHFSDESPWVVALIDDTGFLNRPRWFASEEDAKHYAEVCGYWYVMIGKGRTHAEVNATIMKARG